MDAVVRRPPPAAAAGEEPRDARVVRHLLHSVGLREGDYDARVVNQFLKIAHRYAGDMLVEARAYANHAGRASLEAADMHLAIRAKAAFSPTPPRREVMLDLARTRNTMHLPKSTAPPGSFHLPPLEDIMLSQNHLFLCPIRPPPEQVQETEGGNEGSNPNSKTEKEHNGGASKKQKRPPSLRAVSSRLNAMASVASRRRRMNS